MKKILLMISVIMLTSMMHAQYVLSINGEFVLETDTTITVTDFEEFDGDIEMGFNGTIISSSMVYVDITRPAGAKDELCAGACVEGNGNATQTMEFDLSMGIYAGKMVQVFSHYYPEAVGTATYTYTFRSGEQSACLTVNYVYDPVTSVESIVAPVRSHKITRNGQVIIVRDGVEYNLLGAKL